MTIGTLHIQMSPGKFKNRQVVIKGSGQPTGGGMTGGTIGTQASLVSIVGSMTGITGGRCAFVDTIDVTTGATDTDMLSGQFKGR